MGTNGMEMMIVADWLPSVDICETVEAYHVEMDLPAVKKEDVKVTLDQGVLRMQGERKEITDRKLHRQERAYGRFFRSFSLPDRIDGTRRREVSLKSTEEGKAQELMIRKAHDWCFAQGVLRRVPGEFPRMHAVVIQT
jgi:hypothetical protein